jgi:hypothetical protein
MLIILKKQKLFHLKYGIKLVKVVEVQNEQKKSLLTSKHSFMITLEKLLLELKAETLNEIVGGGKNSNRNSEKAKPCKSAKVRKGNRSSSSSFSSVGTIVV